MIEKQGNIWFSGADAICITTNGIVKKTGEAVMGKGIAAEAAQLYPFLPGLLGNNLTLTGNHCYDFYMTPRLGQTSWIPPNVIITFPTKNDWKDNSDKMLILQSSIELFKLTQEHTEWKRVAIPRPGCGLGKLNWEEDVKPILNHIFLEDKFEIWFR